MSKEFLSNLDKHLNFSQLSSLVILDKAEIQAGLDCGEIVGNTPTINMLASNLGDLKKSGLALPLANSWIAPKLKFTHEG